jgi:DNA-binding response OmpR family regulator
MGNTIIIIDGVEAYRTLLVEFFTKREFAAVGCATYDQAAALVARRRFDIAVVDYFIGASSGAEFCTSLTKRNSGETSLVITSDRQTPDIERTIRRHSPAYYFVKPFEVDNLFAVVLKIIEFRDKKNLQRQNHGVLSLKG